MSPSRDRERLAFVEKYRHELTGLICDAATVARSGVPLSIFLRGAMQRVDQKLGEMFNELKAEPAPLPIQKGKAS